MFFVNLVMKNHFFINRGYSFEKFNLFNLQDPFFKFYFYGIGKY